MLKASPRERGETKNPLSGSHLKKRRKKEGIKETLSKNKKTR
jgi:hypothetical protein